MPRYRKVRFDEFKMVRYKEGAATARSKETYVFPLPCISLPFFEFSLSAIQTGRDIPYIVLVRDFPWDTCLLEMSLRLFEDSQERELSPIRSRLGPSNTYAYVFDEVSSSGRLFLEIRIEKQIDVNLLYDGIQLYVLQE